MSSNQKTLLLIFGLTGFAIGAPLYTIFGNSPEFFVIRRSNFVDLLTAVAVISFLLPLFFYYLSKIVSPAFVIALLITIGFLPQPFAPLLGIGMAVCMVRSQRMREILEFLSFAGFIFPAFFLYQIVSAGTFSEVAPNEGVVNEDTKPVPTIVVIFDEFPLYSLLKDNMEINGERFPGFKKLAGLSTWFRNGTTVTAWTERAVPVILSGNYPDESKRQIPSFNDYPQNLFTLLSKTHTISAYEQVTNLCPKSICVNRKPKEPYLLRMRSLLEDMTIVFLHRILPEQFKKRLPDISFQWGSFLEKDHGTKKKTKGKKGLLNKGDWSDDVWLFEEFINSIQRYEERGKPPLFFLHITFPHVPYRYLPSGKKYIRDMDKRNDRGFKKLWEADDEWPALQAEQRFLLQTGYADSLLKRLLDSLEEQKILDKTLLVVTADHGTSFHPGEHSRTIDEKNSADIMLIPLFIKKVGQKTGSIADLNVETPDVLATVLDENKITPPLPLDGQSVFKKSDKAEKVFYSFEDNKPKKTFHSPLNAAATIAEMNKKFGEGGFNDRFYKFDPLSAKLIGVKIDHSTFQLLEDSTLELDVPNIYNEVDLTRTFIPSYVTGKCSKRFLTDRSQPIAIVINEVIGAVTYPFEGRDGKCNFTGMVQEGLFRQGYNKVSLYLTNR